VIDDDDVGPYGATADELAEWDEQASPEGSEDERADWLAAEAQQADDEFWGVEIDLAADVDRDIRTPREHYERTRDLGATPPPIVAPRSATPATTGESRVHEAFADEPQHFKEDGVTAAMEAKHNAWLNRNDPQRTLEGVRAEVRAALTNVGLTDDDLQLVFARGKPNAARRELRTRAQVALRALYDDGRKRDLLTEAIGCCTRQALHTLMRQRS